MPGPRRATQRGTATTEFKPKDFSRLIGTTGFSEKLLKNHFKLYEGYVKNTNDKAGKIRALVENGDSSSPEFMELQRRFGWEWSGMRLHEYYFGAMTKGGRELEAAFPLADKIANDFGAFNTWKDHFAGIGGMRGIGWAALYYDPEGQRLFNVWIDEHDGGHLTSCQLILILDVFEHAFMVDYGTDKSGYLKAYFNAIDWQVANARYEAAVGAVKVPVTAT